MKHREPEEPSVFECHECGPETHRQATTACLECGAPVCAGCTSNHELQHDAFSDDVAGKVMVLKDHWIERTCDDGYVLTDGSPAAYGQNEIGLAEILLIDDDFPVRGGRDTTEGDWTITVRWKPKLRS